jgi:hypothetical protein
MHKMWGRVEDSLVILPEKLDFQVRYRCGLRAVAPLPKAVSVRDRVPLRQALIFTPLHVIFLACDVGGALATWAKAVVGYRNQVGHVAFPLLYVGPIFSCLAGSGR